MRKKTHTIFYEPIYFFVIIFYFLNLFFSIRSFDNCALSVPPKIAPFDFGEEAQNSGDSVSVQCTISSGDLPMNISWLFNGSSIDATYGVRTVRFGKKVSLLTIDAVRGIHAGNYVCQASNRAATVEYSAQLVVNGKLLLTSFKADSH